MGISIGEALAIEDFMEMPARGNDFRDAIEDNVGIAIGETVTDGDHLFFPAPGQGPVVEGVQ